MTTATSRSLPALRQDLVVARSAPTRQGTLQWVIHDPLQHRYIAIERTAFVLLKLWPIARNIDEIINVAWTDHGETIDFEEIERFIQFLHTHRLTVAPPNGDWRHLAASAARSQASPLTRLLHNYLFFRVPLLHPDPWLRPLAKSMRRFAKSSVAIAIGLIGLLGLGLVSREWDQFIAQAASFMSIDGALAIGVTLFFVKIVHELAHALVAASFGCRVPAIGIAVMLGVPMLYADVTDAWRLPDRRARLCIDAAGMAVEVAIACGATLLWALLPPGFLKQTALLLATSSWMMSLLVNLNPFMRFDGYHMLMDAVAIDNLQERAFALGRWQLRELLFAPTIAAPEPWPTQARRWLVLYAWSVWIYRLLLFTGIALAVYLTFFKALGVLLFIVEIIYFIAWPLAVELREWWHMRKRLVASQRTYVTASLFAVTIAVIVTPWSRSVYAPGVLESAEIAIVFSPEAARIEHIYFVPGQSVDSGTPLFSLRANLIEHEAITTELKLRQVQARLDRRTADEIDREETLVLRQEQAMLANRFAGLATQRADLIIRAPFAGVVAESNPTLIAGRMISPREPLATLRSSANLVVHALVAEQDLWRISIGAAASFVDDNGISHRLDTRLTAISAAPAPIIDRSELASLYGGPIETQADTQNRAKPVVSHYAVRAERITPDDVGTAAQTRRGLLVIDGAAESLLSRTWRHILKVLVRESSL